MIIGRLNGLVLPEQAKFKRDINIPDAVIDRDFNENYDFYTLFYDAFYIRRRRAICLICPALLNFDKVVKRGRFTSGGQQLRISSIWRFKRFSEVWLRCRDVPKSLQFEIDGFKSEIEIACVETQAFSGLNCAVTKSKDNDLFWIKDWAEYHVKVHGLQGLVFFDNNSQTYTVEDVAATLSQVQGLSMVRVIPAPHTFGVYRYSMTWFLQLGLLNIARLRFLSSAAAVLCTDVDELVAPTPEGSVFTSTKRSPLGYLLFRGRWRHARPADKNAIIRHADHIYKTEDDLCRQTKYCVSPKGLCGFSHWDIHGAVRGFLKDYLVTDRFEYWHCRQISTSWMYQRNATASETLLPAPDSIDAFNTVFCSETPQPALVET